MTRKLVWVSWLDAAYLGPDWRKAETIKGGEGAMMESAGFLVRETKEGLYLAADSDPDEEGRYRHVSFIPRAMVRKVKRFKA